MVSRAALDGIRVIDLATPRAELAGRVLADLGAEVLKLEPAGGARARALPPFDGEDSLYWAAVGLGKRSAVLDLERESDRERLRALADLADVLIESFDPGTLAAHGLDAGVLCARCPHLIYASITPFGQDGPLSRAPATDLTLEAAGGLVGLQGDGDRPPIPAGFPQASFHAGVQAAADILIALCERARSGRGQHLDLSMQSAVVWTLMNATGYPPMIGGNPPGTSEFRADPPPQPIPGLVLPRLAQCRDGHALAGFGLPGIGERSFHALLRWVEQEGSLPEDLRGRDWNGWIGALVGGKLTPDQVTRGIEAVLGFLRGRSKAEIQAFGVEHGIVLAPIYDADDLRRDPQLADRKFWTTVGDRTHPGPFARLSRTPVRMDRPAPALDADASLLRAWERGARERRASGEDTSRGVFAGLRVADFAWVGVGPIISKALADHGATVIHVESEHRPDVLRLLPAFKDNQRGINRSHFQANFNTSKLGLALNLQTDAGRALARRLSDWADVVVESFSPGNMQKFGLDYATLSVSRPELVMLSTCMRGQTGPERRYSGFGTQGAALAGLHAITGWPDRPPHGTWGAYTDFIAPRYGVCALAAALFHRARTGKGQHIDLSQIEAAIRFHEPLLLEHDRTGRAPRAMGHDSLFACPHGVYPARGKERYVALACESDAQWAALRALAGLGRFLPADAPFVARRSCRGEIDRALAGWTRDQEPFALAQRLREAGVPAYVVLRPTDLYQDPQLLHREFFVTLDHTEMGPTPFDGLVTRFSRTPGRLRRAAPCVGEHTQQVLTALGLSEAEVTEAAIAGALS
jgi:crotonobetainyl-CoA:carnitine CoA-transferase CaiB-like acyl-CoA transferase